MNPHIREKLEEFVAIDSAGDADKSEILAAAVREIGAMGLPSHVYGDVKAVAATFGAGGVVFNGHLDTVPFGSGWTRRHGEVVGDRMYGRGTADMKGGCVAMLAAARELLAEKVPFSLFFTTDEETTMRAASTLHAEPFLREAAAVVVGEPTSLRIVGREKGILWFEVRTQGRSAHGSTPHLGDNAIHRMMRILREVEPLSRPRDYLLELTINIGAIRGGSKPNVVADECAADLDVRFPPTMTDREAKAMVESLIAKSSESAELTIKHFVPAAAVDPRFPHIAAMQKLAGSEVGTVSYGTEMAWFVASNPRCLVLGPGPPDHIHVPDEFVDLPEVERAADIYATYARAVAPRPAR